MTMFKWMWVALGASMLVACGGGGGDPGSSPFGSGSGTGNGTGNGTGSTATYGVTLEVQRANVATTQITSTETVQAVATVTSSSGAPVEGVVVSFTESQGSLVDFAPQAGTALTDAAGKAVVDLSASSASSTGATTISASATVGSTAVSATRSIQVTAGAVTGGIPPVPAAITFVGSNPSGTAIVIKGAGGTGRSESAILTFRIVDASNAPINSAKVNFTINADNGGALISPLSSLSNSDGIVTTTVSSGTQPASIVVKATADSVPTVTSQSDTLIVSNSVPVVGGFEIVADKYNLDGRKTGDKTKISAYVRDEFGNPVPDGVAVSFVTDFGAVASSTLGGCTTLNGTCTVDFRVQEPRGTGIATVIGTVRVGAGQTLVAGLQINMAGASGAPYLALDADTSATVTKLTLTSCKEVVELLLSDGSGHAPAAGTTIGVPLTSTGTAVTVKSGTPVLDQLADGFPPVDFAIEVDVSTATLVPQCKVGGTIADSPAFFRFEFKTPASAIVFTQRVELAYPQ
jgi:hypothetical protein